MNDTIKKILWILLYILVGAGMLFIFAFGVFVLLIYVSFRFALWTLSSILFPLVELTCFASWFNFCDRIVKKLVD